MTALDTSLKINPSGLRPQTVGIQSNLSKGVDGIGFNKLRFSSAPPPSGDGDRLEVSSTSAAVSGAGEPPADSSAENGESIAPAAKASVVEPPMRFPWLLGGIRRKLSGVKAFLNSDNALVAKGVFFKHIVPLMFSLSAFVPVWGIPLAAAGIFLSYPSGRYGSRLLARVNQNDNPELLGALKNIHKIDDLLDHPDKAKNPNELVDTIGKFIDDALDVTRFPFLKRIVNVIRPTPNNVFGRAIMKYNKIMLLAKVNQSVANANSVGDAAIQGVKGGAHFMWWGVMIPKIGAWIVKGSNFAPTPINWLFKGLGYLLEFSGLISLATDIAGGTSPSSKPTPQAA
jgi:hypothetical protein